MRTVRCYLIRLRVEITRHGGAVGEDRALHQRVAADKVMPHELLHADAPVQPGHDRTPLDVVLGTNQGGLRAKAEANGNPRR